MKYTPAQHQAIYSKANHVSVVAAAGSGKTSVLMERYVHWVMDEKISPERMIALTYTQKSAEEMRSRIMSRFWEKGEYKIYEELDSCSIATIHGFCHKIIKDYPVDSGVDPQFSVLPEDFSSKLKEQVFENLMDEVLAADASPFRALFDFTSLYQIRNCLFQVYERWRSQADPLAENHADHESVLFKNLVMRFHDLYQRAKWRQAKIDYDDQMLMALNLLKRDEFRTRFLMDYDAILVDEFQDVNPLQYQILKLLSGGLKTFVVGDVRQSIYGFRHADSRLFETHHQAVEKLSDGECVDMNQNFRSSATIIQLINQLFSERETSPGRVFGKMTPAGSQKEAPPSLEWIPGLSPTVNKEFKLGDLRKQEAESLSVWIKRYANREDCDYSDIALLLRKSTALDVFEEAFKKHSIPYHLVKGSGFYYQPEIIDLLGALLALSKPDDNVALASLIKSPLVGISDDALYSLRENKDRSLWDAVHDDSVRLAEADRSKLSSFRVWFEALRKDSGDLSLRQIIERVIQDANAELVYMTSSSIQNGLWNLLKLKDEAAEYEAYYGAHALGFVEFIRDLMTREEVEETEAVVGGDSRGAVQIMTVHAAKGLEFPVICLGDLGTPIHRTPTLGTFVMNAENVIVSQSPEIKKPDPESPFMKAKAEIMVREREEALRLFYVAMTRAKHKIVLSGTSHGKETWMDWVLGQLPELTPTKLPEMDPAKTARAKQKSDETLLLAESSPVEDRSRNYPETQNFTVSQIVHQKIGGIAEARPENSWPEDDTAEEISRSRYGNLFHEMLQHVDLGKEPDDEMRRFDRIYSDLMSADLKRRLLASLGAFLSEPRTREIKKAYAGENQFYRELPFRCRIGEGARCLGFMKGQVDLVYQNAEGSWVLIDYKTSDTVRTEHEWQMMYYAYALRRLIPEMPKEAYLYYTKLGLWHPVNLKSIELPVFETELYEDFKVLVNSHATMGKS